MPGLSPVSRDELIKGLRLFGFEGPFTASDHEVMTRGKFTFKVPNPHKKKDIGVPLLKKLLNQVGISTKDWLARK